jgi:hypothetical protein
MPVTSRAPASNASQQANMPVRASSRARRSLSKGISRPAVQKSRGLRSRSEKRPPSEHRPDLSELLGGATSAHTWSTSSSAGPTTAWQPDAVAAHVRASSRSGTPHAGFDGYRTQEFDLALDDEEAAAGRRPTVPVPAL